jgi:pseudouridine synthase
MNNEEYEISIDEIDKRDVYETEEAATSSVMRLQKAMAHAGVASRRVCEELITKGKVKVNGKVVTELGSRVDTAVDKVTVNGTPIQFDSTRVYLALNKPMGVVSSMSDDMGRPDLQQFVLDYDHVYNVGRLDAETTGLLLLTNDGDLANKLAHPKFGVTKTYVARVAGIMPLSVIQQLLEGIELEDGEIAADKAHIIDHKGDETLVEIVLHSGRNRIVRRMLEAVGHPVRGLVRKQFGPIHLGTLRPGDVRQLNKMEVGALLKAADGKNARTPRPEQVRPGKKRPQPANAKSKRR